MRNVYYYLQKKILPQLLSQEPERIEVVESEFDWWKPINSASDSDVEDAHMELCVKTERSKTLWSHLSSPEKKRVCELIGYVEGEPAKDRSKQCIGIIMKILSAYFIICNFFMNTPSVRIVFIS